MSIKTSFNYPNTCPTIDKNISEFEHVLHNEVEVIIRELCPVISEEFSYTSVYKRLVENYVDNLYSQAQPIFENVRTCNSDMREEINHVIDSFVDEIEELQDEIKNLNYTLEKSQEEVSRLEDELQSMSERIKELENEK